MNLAAAASLVVCFTVMAAWAGSYARPGHFEVDGAALHNDSVEIGSEWAWRVSSARGVLDVQLVSSFYEWNIGYWKLALASLVLPGRWAQLRLRRRRQRLLAGRCLTCGYDLRASTDRCPECGTPIRPSVEATV